MSNTDSTLSQNNISVKDESEEDDCNEECENECKDIEKGFFVLTLEHKTDECKNQCIIISSDPNKIINYLESYLIENSYTFGEDIVLRIVYENGSQAPCILNCCDYIYIHLPEWKTSNQHKWYPLIGCIQQPRPEDKNFDDLCVDKKQLKIDIVQYPFVPSKQTTVFWEGEERNVEFVYYQTERIIIQTIKENYPISTNIKKKVGQSQSQSSIKNPWWIKYHYEDVDDYDN